MCMHGAKDARKLVCVVCAHESAQVYVGSPVTNAKQKSDDGITSTALCKGHEHLDQFGTDVKFVCALVEKYLILIRAFKV